MKFKAVLFSAGLVAMGLVAAVRASEQVVGVKKCINIQENGALRNHVQHQDQHCLSKEFPYTTNKACTCPNPNYQPQRVKKCYVPMDKLNTGVYGWDYAYHCESP